MHRPLHPISRKLTRLTMLASGAALLVACLLFFTYDLYTVREAIVRNLSVQAEIIGYNSVTALVFDDAQAANKTISAMESFPRILSVQIYDVNGRPFAGFWKDHTGAPPLLPRTPSRTQDVHWFDWRGARELALLRPINFQGQNYGTVYIRSNLSALTDRFWRYVAIILIVIVAALAAAWLVSRTSQRVITQPITELAGLAQVVSRDKNYSLRASAQPERSEITTLVESFNDMLAQIQSRDTALRQAHDELEQRVVERTAELKQAEENLRLLSGQLLQVLDEERRRIARELHDSTGQVLAALAMNLAVMQSEARPGEATARATQESLQLVQDLSKELRTISYLLHPPLLDETGLESALRWYVQGFAERSGIDARLLWPPDLGRLPRELETAIFRIVQECLTNIHRHSDSRTAEIAVNADSEKVRVHVVDRGRGIKKAAADSGRVGVGIRGMRERVTQLGGNFEVNSNGEGTRVTAVLPLHRPTTLGGQPVAVSQQTPDRHGDS